ncbi:hypothetical protein FB451DRAFT_1223158 [Mycena latifolia]|nr:hypothetical protein FB451DRAFT_1223158 [Mycena latifolia]
MIRLTQKYPLLLEICTKQACDILFVDIVYGFPPILSAFLCVFLLYPDIHFTIGFSVVLLGVSSDQFVGGGLGYQAEVPTRRRQVRMSLPTPSP